jgi:hypothetical protein
MRRGQALMMLVWITAGDRPHALRPRQRKILKSPPAEPGLMARPVSTSKPNGRFKY